MARVKTVCMNCGNIMMAGNGTEGSGDENAKMVYIKVCSACPEKNSKRSGCSGTAVVTFLLVALISLMAQ